ncbi:ATP-binding cassette domain-containing protein [Bailinhaonella thermotolerans]|uniref:ATP-binding cassette domain-containing protein n=1 Tax=Bailinhaonella thermotolerans TaxID=1070861 RepID=A0A3A4ANG8_9ACTN|nr:ATP-binding cassette domain-containing protein [Bailinhaonella thermotolerans]
MIVVEGLRKAYGRAVALDGLDLEAAGGTVTGLLGPNGAGKTTLIRCAAPRAERRDGPGPARLDRRSPAGFNVRACHVAPAREQWAGRRPGEHADPKEPAMIGLA